MMDCIEITKKMNFKVVTKQLIVNEFFSKIKVQN